MKKQRPLTPNQRDILDVVRAKPEGDVVTITHVYGPGKNTLNSMEKRGILTVLNRDEWSKTCQAKVKLSPWWQAKAVPQQLSVTLCLTLDEHAEVLRYLGDAQAHLDGVLVQHQHPDAVRELFKKRDRIEELKNRIKGQAK